MRILVIADVHQQIDRLARVLARVQPTVDHTVFLGDFFDSYEWNVDDVAKTIDFLNAHVGAPNETVLMGNHDLHYLYPARECLCSGYKMITLQMVEVGLKPHVREKLSFYHWTHGDILLSHAGLSRKLLTGPAQSIDELRRYLSDMQDVWFSHDYKTVRKFGLSPYELFAQAGYGRGGSGRCGSLTWADWEREFQPYPGIRQIVGHTVRKHGPEWDKDRRNVCIDTHLNDYAIIEDDGTITTHPVHPDDKV